MTFPPAVRALLESQDGVVHVDQLLAAGLTRAAVRWMTGRSLRVVAPAVLSAFTGGSLTARQRLVVAQLYAGTGGVVSGRAAATWHGVTAATGYRTVTVELPAARHPRSPAGITVRRTYRPESSPWFRPPLTIASRERAVVQAARESPSDLAQEIVIEAVQRRLVTVDLLRAELDAGESAGSAKVRRGVDIADLGAWSVSEGEMLDALDGIPGVPPPLLNPVLVVPDGTVLPRPDGWFDDVALAVQVHSRRHHGEEADFDSTIMSDGIFAEYGIAVVSLTPTRLRADRPAVRRRVEKAWHAAAARPRPTVRVA